MSDVLRELGLVLPSPQGRLLVVAPLGSEARTGSQAEKLHTVTPNNLLAEFACQLCSSQCNTLKRLCPLQLLAPCCNSL